MATVRTLIGNIKGPKGDTGSQGPQGEQGPGATINVGTVSTTAYGNPVQITNSGTETDAVLDFVIPQGKPGEQTTKMSLLTLDTITTQTAEYPIPAVGDVGSTAWGKIVKFFNDIKTAVTGKVDKTSIVNNLTSTSTDKPLSAAQGKALNDALAFKVLSYTAYNKSVAANAGFTITTNDFGITPITGWTPVAICCAYVSHDFIAIRTLRATDTAGSGVIQGRSFATGGTSAINFEVRMLYVKSDRVSTTR